MNIFEKASRKALRFPSIKGELTTEQLWILPLTSRTGWDLDTVAREVNKELKSISEDSFVVTTTNPAKETLELKLEIVKHIIADQLLKQEIAKKAAQRKDERDRLVEILHQKKDQELLSLTPEEIQQKLAELDNPAN